MPTGRFKNSDPITSGALVTVADEKGAEHRFLMLPVAGGISVEYRGRPVRVVTPTSPVGAALLERTEGDEVVARIGGTRREFEILAVE